VVEKNLAAEYHSVKMVIMVPASDCCLFCKRKMEKKKLLRCSGCKCAKYCSKEHQQKDWKTHSKGCKRIQNLRDRYELEEMRLRQIPESEIFWLAQNRDPDFNIFEVCAGRFWGILDTRDYMRGRYGLFLALVETNTQDSLHEALFHGRECLRLCRSDNVGIRDQVTEVMLRLDLSQDVYDLVMWYGTMGASLTYDWGNRSLPFLNVYNADVTEDLNETFLKNLNLGHLIALAMVKHQVLLCLKRTNEMLYFLLGLALETESRSAKVLGANDVVLQRIRDFLDTSDLSIRKSVLRVAATNGILHLRDQVRIQRMNVFQEMYRRNKHMQYMFETDPTPLEAPNVYIHGDTTEALLIVKHAYDTWKQTEDGLFQLNTLQGGTLSDFDFVHW